MIRALTPGLGSQAMQAGHDDDTDALAEGMKKGARIASPISMPMTQHLSCTTSISIVLIQLYQQRQAVVVLSQRANGDRTIELGQLRLRQARLQLCQTDLSQYVYNVQEHMQRMTTHAWETGDTDDDDYDDDDYRDEG